MTSPTQLLGFRMSLLAASSRRAVASATVTTTMLLSTGCYNYTMRERAELVPGGHNSFDLTDQGRVELAQRLGSGVARVEGTVVSADSSAIVLRVASTESIRGETSNWGGETVTIRQAVIAHVAQRELSVGKTAVAIGAAAVALGAFIVTRTLAGNGGVTGGVQGPPAGQTSRR
jgi:hypothetical protein